MATEKKTATQYRRAAQAWEGQLWRPEFVVTRGHGGWYWRDMQADDGPSGPFPSAGAAWRDICEFFGL